MIEISRPEVFERQPVVSVLMLTYNHQPHIAEAIEGVLAQVCPFPIELIVAEDCSKDKTRAIAEQFMEQNPAVIRIVTGEKNIGAMPNFYRALAQCRGRYIALCEGDDYWCNSEKLAKQVAMLEEDERVGMVHGNFVNCRFEKGTWVKDEAGAQDLRTRSELEGDVFSVNMHCLMPRTCTTIFRHSVLKAFLKTPLANPRYIVGDVPLVVFCSAYWRVGYIDEIVAVYRHAVGSITRSGMAGTLAVMDSVGQIHADFRTMFSERPDYDPRAAIPFHVSMAYAALREKNKQAFDRAVGRLKEINPRLAWTIPGIVLRRAMFVSSVSVNLANFLIDRLMPPLRRLQS